jgi:hypothetical protein
LSHFVLFVEASCELSPPTKRNGEGREGGRRNFRQK